MGGRKIIWRLVEGAEGSAAVMAALVLVALLGAASLAIDMGQLYTVRNELQNNADAAALAAASSLIQDYGAGAVRDSYKATQAALLVAQRQSQLSGQEAVPDADRNDLAIIFGEWNVKAGSPDVAWTEIGPSCGSYSNANAVKITLRRAAGTAYGPVANFLATVLGYNTSEVGATATAYLGYTTETPTGTVQVPLALPTDIVVSSKAHSGWFASLLGPREATASTKKTYTFKDTGGGNVDNGVTEADPLDPAHAYLFTVGQNDSVPGTLWDILNRIYDPSYTSGNPVAVGNLKWGQQIYPRSEFMYGKSYISPIFQRLQWAYNYKTTGNKNTAPAPGTRWRVTLPVYSTTAHPLAFQHPHRGVLARLLGFISPAEAYACYTMPPPKAYITGFVNADITNVTYSSSCDDCSYTFPKTISGHKYNNKKDCLTNYSNSTWNKNTVTLENVTDGDTAPPSNGGSLSGGLSNHDINPSGATKGAFASVPRLVK
jgi:Flp pilus assembly protein TadG